jgi:hypothetical protein
MLWVFRVEGQWENATWAWGLYEDDSQHTRLVSRLRVSYKWARPSIVPMLLTDAVELVMMRKCLSEERRSSRGSPPSRMSPTTRLDNVVPCATSRVWRRRVASRR